MTKYRAHVSMSLGQKEKIGTEAEALGLSIPQYLLTCGMMMARVHEANRPEFEKAMREDK